MALGFATTLRNSRAAAIRDAIDGGTGAGKLRIYNGSRPANGGTVTTMLAELTFSDPCAGTPSGGVVTASAITSDSAADNSGTATWFRCVDAANTFVMDGDCGTSGSDLNLNSTTIGAGQQVACSSFVITEGNAGL